MATTSPPPIRTTNDRSLNRTWGTPPSVSTGSGGASHHKGGGGRTTKLVEPEEVSGLAGVLEGLDLGDARDERPRSRDGGRDAAQQARRGARQGRVLPRDL